MKQKKLLLTGSHAGATAIALIRQIKKQGFPWKISWIGKKWATEDEKSFTLEYNSLPKLGVNFYSLESGRIQPKFTRFTISALLKVPVGFVVAGYYVLKVRPNLILSFGGAAGAEVAFWGWVFGIPVILHEQTATAGRANLFSARFARVVALSRLSSKEYFKGKKTVVTGNPISTEIASLKFKSKKAPETLFITGGSRGSQRINETVTKSLPWFLDRFKVIHQVGAGNLSGFNTLGTSYRVYGQIEPQKWVGILSGADIVISRAGANIVSELIALKKPCILIPIPWSYLDEQMANALFAKNFGIARVIPQDELTPERLKEEVEFLTNNYSQIVNKVSDKESPDLNAARKLTSLVVQYLE